MDLLEKTTICRQWICNASISRRASRRDYPVSWQVNGVTLDARKTVTFRQNDRGQLTPCLPEDLLQAGVNPAVLSRATGATSRSCPELNALLPAARSFRFCSSAAGNDHSSGADDAPGEG